MRNDIVSMLSVVSLMCIADHYSIYRIQGFLYMMIDLVGMTSSVIRTR